MKKFLIKLILTVAAVVTLISSVAFADFTDMPADPTARAALETAVKNGLLTGYDTGEIKPVNNIKRCEMAAIIVRAFGAAEMAENFQFGDVRPEHWYYDVMSKAVKMGVFKGDGTNLNPENDITFQEAFTVLTRVFDLFTNYDVARYKYEIGISDQSPVRTYAAIEKFTDGADVAAWAKDTATAIVEGGYWNPADNMLRPTAPINRTEFAILMNNLVTTYIDEPGVYDSLPAGNVVVRSDAVTIKNFNSPAAKIIVGAGVGDEDIVIDSDVVVERLVGYSGNIVLGGTFDFVRLIGSDCVGKLENTIKVNIQAASKNGSKFSVGVKEI